MNPELIEKNIYQAIDAMDDEKLEKYAYDLKFSILKAIALASKSIVGSLIINYLKRV
ncbi:MAG: hypothetical protein ACRC2S_09395 [Waterburya sp.]